MTITINNKYLSHIIKIGIIGGLCILLYAPTFSMFIYDWTNDENYSHGFLVPFIVAYLVWEKKTLLRQLNPQPSIWGLGILFGGLMVYLLGTVGAEWFLKRSSLIIVLGGLILYLYGKSYIKALIFPLVFLIFMVPLPAIIYKAMAFQLQLFVSTIAERVIGFIGIPIFRSGNILYLASGPLSVEEACSGMRSIMALLALSSIFAYLMYRTWLKRWLIVAFALPIAVVTNIIRVTTTGILANYYGQKIAEGFLHTSFGWIVFVIAFVLLFLLSQFLDWILPETNSIENSR